MHDGVVAGDGTSVGVAELDDVLRCDVVDKSSLSKRTTDTSVRKSFEKTKSLSCRLPECSCKTLDA